MSYPPCIPLRAAHDSGRRQASSIRQVVIHSTEGGTAKSVAQFFHTTAQASTQLVVDDRTCYRCVPDLVIPWGAPGVNATGLHVELCGFARWDAAEWLKHEAMLKRAAFKCAVWAWTYDIPRRWLSAPQVSVGGYGFLRHMDASAAFTPGGHTDPGTGFDRSHFMQLVDAAHAEIVAERSR